MLHVRDLSVEFHTDDGVIYAVNQACFHVGAGETLGIVGESGSGKSVSNLALLGLIPTPPGRITGGTARFLEHDLISLTNQEKAAIRGKDISFIFQDPMTSLNPYLSIGTQLIEAPMQHLKMPRNEALKLAAQRLEGVGITDGARRLKQYPHQFSGGQRQRIMIAMALMTKPRLLIADEPTTALDVTIQAQILELLKERRRAEKLAMILITHNMGVVAGMADRVAVMYGGRVVETAETGVLFTDPRHPYTAGLLSAIPRADVHTERLQSIPGTPPHLTAPVSNCPYHPRCPYATEICKNTIPADTTDGTRSFACHHPLGAKP